MVRVQRDGNRENKRDVERGRDTNGERQQERWRERERGGEKVLISRIKIGTLFVCVICMCVSVHGCVFVHLL